MQRLNPQPDNKLEGPDLLKSTLKGAAIGACSGVALVAMIAICTEIQAYFSPPAPPIGPEDFKLISELCLKMAVICGISGAKIGHDNSIMRYTRSLLESHGFISLEHTGYSSTLFIGPNKKVSNAKDPEVILNKNDKVSTGLSHPRNLK